MARPGWLIGFETQLRRRSIRCRRTSTFGEAKMLDSWAVEFADHAATSLALKQSR